MRLNLTFIFLFRSGSELACQGNNLFLHRAARSGLPSRKIAGVPQMCASLRWIRHDDAQALAKRSEPSHKRRAPT